MKKIRLFILQQLTYWKNNKTIFPFQLIILSFLLVITPLVYGSVEEGAVFFLETSILILIFTLFFNFILKRQVKLRYISFLWGMMLFLLYVFVTLPFSIYAYETIISLTKIVFYVLTFVFLIQVFNSKKRLYYLIWTIALFGAFYAISAFLFRKGFFLGFKVFSEAPHINLTFVNRNHFAGYLEMIVWLIVGLAILQKGFMKLFLFLLAFFVAFAIIMSLSRGGVIALLTSFSFFTLIYALNKRDRKFILFSVLFITALLLFLITVGIEPLLSRFDKLQSDTMEDIGRIEYWKSTFALIQSKPWFGAGLGTFSTAIPPFQTPNTSGMFISHAHNDYLELLSEVGIVGFVILIATFSLSFYSILKKIFFIKNERRFIISLVALSSIFSIAIHSFFDFNLHIPSNAFLFSTLWAIAFLGSEENFNQRILTVNISKIKKKYLSLVLLGLFFSSVYYVGKPYFAARFVNIAKEKLKERDDTAAVRNVNNAILMDGGNSENYVVKANVLLKMSFRTKKDSLRKMFRLNALDYYNMAINRNPNNAYYYQNKAYSLTLLDELDAAGSSIRKAISLSPTTYFYRYNLVKLYFRQKKNVLAIKEASKLLLLDQAFMNSIVSHYIELGLSYDSIGKLLPNTIAVKTHYINYLIKNHIDTLLVQELTNLYDLEPTEKKAEKLMIFASRLKDFDTQLIICQKYLKIYPNSISLNKSLAKIYIHKGDAEKAKQIYLSLLKREPSDANLHYLISSIYKREKNIERQLNSLKTACKLAPQNDRYRFVLAKEYQRHGLLQLAISEYKICVKLKPEKEIYRQAAEKLMQNLDK